MADQMKATPRSPILGLFSDIVNLPLQYMSAPERTQQMQGTAEFLYGTGIPKTLERMSYGDSLFSGAGGLGGTTRMRPETAEAVLNVAPFAPIAGRVAGRMIKATKGMPVGMGIKDVGKNIFEDATKYHQKVPEIKSINVDKLKRMNAGEVADVSDEVAAKMDFSEPIKVSVFADGELRIVDGHHRVAAAKKLGIQSLPVELQAINAKGATLNKLAQEATYPQQAALPTGATGLPSPQSLTMPSVPTVEQMQKYGRTETVPLSKAVSFQSARDWEKFNAGKYNGDLVAGYGDKPLALRLETGEYVIYDGNHRTDLALQKGLTELLMNVIDVKSYDPTHAGRRPVPPSMSDDELLNSLLGNEVKAPQQVQQEISPTYSDPFGNTIGSSIR